jgi:hypothetical protein
MFQIYEYVANCTADASFDEKIQNIRRAAQHSMVQLIYALLILNNYYKFK